MAIGVIVYTLSPQGKRKGCKRGRLIISDHWTSSEGRQAGVLCVSAGVREPRRSYKCIPRQVFPIIKGYKCDSELILLTEIGHLLVSLFLFSQNFIYLHASMSKKKKGGWKDLGNPGAWSSCARPGIKGAALPLRNPVHIANRSL